MFWRHTTRFSFSKGGSRPWSNATFRIAADDIPHQPCGTRGSFEFFDRGWQRVQKPQICTYRDDLCALRLSLGTSLTDRHFINCSFSLLWEQSSSSSEISLNVYISSPTSAWSKRVASIVTVARVNCSSSCLRVSMPKRRNPVFMAVINGPAPMLPVDILRWSDATCKDSPHTREKRAGISEGKNKWIES